MSRELQSAPESSPEQPACYECRRELALPVDASFCPYCGAALDPDEDAYQRVEARVIRFLRKQGAEMVKNPLGFFIHWGIYVFVFALGAAIVRGCVEEAVRTVGGS